VDEDVIVLRFGRYDKGDVVHLPIGVIGRAGHLTALASGDLAIDASGPRPRPVLRCQLLLRSPDRQFTRLPDVRY
jgi:hypothetical protein